MSTSTRILTIAIAALAASAWWLLSTPALDYPPASNPPVFDADLLAQRDAALALALIPDDPWSFAETMAASTPAVEDRATCGLDQQPQGEVASADDEAAPDADTDAPPVASKARPAGPAWLAELARVDAALRASSDPFERAVSEWLNVGGAQQPVDIAEALAQRASTSSDARLYALAFRACHEAPGPSVEGAGIPTAFGANCAMLDARRWTELDPGNGVPWMFVHSKAVGAGDPTAAQEALTRMATAPRFEDHLHAAGGAVVAHASSDERGLAADFDLAQRAFQKSVSQLESFGPLLDVCKDGAGGDANRAQECAAIGAAMTEHGDSLLMQAMGSVVILRATGDATVRDRYRAERMEMEKQSARLRKQSECQVVRDGLQSVRRGAEVGELRAMHEQLLEARKEAP